mmetsp:Transcript_55194/g.145234  ORF Transcript_55194/g.145234 Transcript_55194/m.145234 type:complete len:276 (-) Transcript_55194:86-913(-)
MHQSKYSPWTTRAGGAPSSAVFAWGMRHSGPAQGASPGGARSTLAALPPQGHRFDSRSRSHVESSWECSRANLRTMFDSSKECTWWHAAASTCGRDSAGMVLSSSERPCCSICRRLRPTNSCTGLCTDGRFLKPGWFMVAMQFLWDRPGSTTPMLGCPSRSGPRPPGGARVSGRCSSCSAVTPHSSPSSIRSNVSSGPRLENAAPPAKYRYRTIASTTLNGWFSSSVAAAPDVADSDCSKAAECAARMALCARTSRPSCATRVTSVRVPFSYMLW